MTKREGFSYEKAPEALAFALATACLVTGVWVTFFQPGRLATPLAALGLAAWALARSWRMERQLQALMTANMQAVKLMQRLIDPHGGIAEAQQEAPEGKPRRHSD